MSVLERPTAIEPPDASAQRNDVALRTSDVTDRTSPGRIHPAALSSGAIAWGAVWLVGLAIARLTGAAAVVLLLVASLVALLGATIAGWWRLRGVGLVDITTPTTAVAGEAITVTIGHRGTTGASSPIDLEMFDVATSLDAATSTTVSIELPHAGLIDHVDAIIRSAGAPGLFWWQRRVRVEIDTMFVAPSADGASLPVERHASTDPGTSASGQGPRIGDLDGTRPWRPGECQQAIHWPSTMRTGEVIAHERVSATESRWILPITAEAARLRRTMEDGLRHGVHVVLETEDGTTPIRHRDDVLRWSAIAAERQHPQAPPVSTLALWKRKVSWPTSPEQSTTVSTRARVLTAIAALVALQMLIGALNGSLLSRVGITLGLIVGTAVSLWASAGHRPAWLRVIVSLLGLAALARIAVQASGIGGLLEALRGPMPDLLILLVALHGAEVTDRRTNRVHLAITWVVVAYAAGLRIDGNVGWWMLAWGLAAIAASTTSDATRRATTTTGTTTSPTNSKRRPIAVLGWSATGLAATIGLAAFVPIPDGPASLGLPALSPSDAAVDTTGALLDPSGNPQDSAPTSDAPSRGALGQAGGYPGFSDTLDTAVRGDLGDEIVMRVRAPEPAFWRGQIFTEFDGRTWRVTPEEGRRVDGPQINVAPTIGDLPISGTPTEEFVQTFTVEADLPNVIFGAGRPETVVFDGSVVTRSDGTLRADRTLTDGTVYSVVSQRVAVTPASLRAQGDLGERFEPFASESEIARFLRIPDSTSQATLDLAADLRTEGSTYDTILAYQDWMALNTQYDLNAPVPDGDAVDDFLFGEQRGFCEQIASSLVVLLRSQGVPARLATGYIPGTRDRISGVFEVKASDAHAWVEVWFPDTGWEAFDPTADVPLAGDADRSTVGADAAAALLDGLLAKPVEAGGAAALLIGAFAALRGITELRRRRARGPWGLLHDRFMSLAPDAVTAPAAAAHLVTLLGPDAVIADEVAATLDRVAFDPDHQPADDDRRRVATNITDLERHVRRGGDVHPG